MDARYNIAIFESEFRAAHVPLKFAYVVVEKVSCNEFFKKIFEVHYQFPGENTVNLYYPDYIN